MLISILMNISRCFAKFLSLVSDVIRNEMVGIPFTLHRNKQLAQFTLTLFSALLHIASDYNFYFMVLTDICNVLNQQKF